MPSRDIVDITLLADALSHTVLMTLLGITYRVVANSVAEILADMAGDGFSPVGIVAVREK